MPLFGSASEEAARKENLKKLEDKRVAFAQKLDETGFRPEKMLFLSGEKGNYVAFARHEGRFAMLTSPVLGSEDDFALEWLDQLRYRTEEVAEPGTGFNGIFGFGKKASVGYYLFVENSQGQEVRIDILTNRSLYLEVGARKNPLLSTKRRRGDANVTWDLKPLESIRMSRFLEHIEAEYLNG